MGFEHFDFPTSLPANDLSHQKGAFKANYDFMS